jgi:DNA-binding MarR family transcriptional regulator
MTKMIQRMTDRGYLKVSVDPDDSRKRVIGLSRLARKRLPAFERIWAAGQQAVAEILKANPGFLRSLQSLESEMGRKSFLDRARKNLDG